MAALPVRAVWVDGSRRGEKVADYVFKNVGVPK
jgi:hypothetical protein